MQLRGKIKKFKKLRATSLWVLGLKHKRILTLTSIIRVFLSLLDIVFLFLITALASIITQRTYQNEILELFHLENLNSSQIMYVITSIIVIKNLGSIFLQRYTLQALANREAEISAILARMAVFESDDLSKASNSSEIMQTLTSSIPVLFNNLYKKIVTFIGELTTMLAIIIAIIIFDWKLATFLFAFFFLTGLTMLFYISRKQKKIGELSQSFGRILIQNYTELLLLKTELRLLHRYSDFIGVTYLHQKNLSKIQSQGQLLTFVPRYLLEIFLVVAIATVILYMQYFVDDAPILIVVSFLVTAGFRILPSLNLVILGFGSFHNSTSALIRIEKLGKRFDIQNKELKFDLEKVDLKTTPFEGDLVFDQVTFGYPDSNNNIFRNLSFSLSQNKTLLVKGVSGSGKTTLIGLATGILTPQAGKIFMCSKNTHVSMVCSISGISLLRQNVPLFDESFEYNIAMRNVNDYEENQLKKVAKSAGISERILNSPKCFKTRIGEKGLMLSAGERQRLGLARSLFSQPSLLVLDEPTANLDSDSEMQIWKSLEALKGTLSIIIVSHKEVPEKVYDAVIVLS